MITTHKTKKTGEEVIDRFYIERKNKDPKETIFKIHFPYLIGDAPSSVGVNVTVTMDQFKELSEHVDRILAWSCPECGKSLHNYRRSELDWDYKRCDYCGWEENKY